MRFHCPHFGVLVLIICKSVVPISFCKSNAAFYLRWKNQSGSSKRAALMAENICCSTSLWVRLPQCQGLLHSAACWSQALLDFDTKCHVLVCDISVSLHFTEVSELICDVGVAFRTIYLTLTVCVRLLSRGSRFGKLVDSWLQLLRTRVVQISESRLRNRPSGLFVSKRKSNSNVSLKWVSSCRVQNRCRLNSAVLSWQMHVVLKSSIWIRTWK